MEEQKREEGPACLEEPRPMGRRGPASRDTEGEEEEAHGEGEREDAAAAVG
jgi:hypothetical protein